VRAVGAIASLLGWGAGSFPLSCASKKKRNASLTKSDLLYAGGASATCAFIRSKVGLSIRILNSSSSVVLVSDFIIYVPLLGNNVPQNKKKSTFFLQWVPMYPKVPIDEINRDYQMPPTK